ncbi:MAG: cobalt ECF transporter T component CbiQ, partial [Candidatus Caldatribacteriaceae bacterium]
EARLGYRSYWQGLRSMAFLVGSLFFYAFQAMEQFRLSLEARGFEGELAVLPPEFRPLGIKRISLFLGVGIGGLFLVLSGRLWR